MKHNFLYNILILSVTMTLVSCVKEPDMPVALHEQAYSKEIKVSDSNSENWLILKVSCHDEQTLMQYSAQNFKLLPIPFGKELCQIAIPEIEPDTLSEDAVGEIKSNRGVHVSFEIIDQHKANGIKSLAITFQHPLLKHIKGERYYWHYSQAGQNLERTASICDVHWWWDCHYGLKYKAYENSGWSTIVSEWTKVPNRSCDTRTRETVYQYQFHVRARRNTAYTVNFEP